MADDFDFWKLIAGPIQAMNEAEAASAARFVDLMTEYAFEPGETAEAPRRLRELTFDMRRIGSNGQVETRRISIPLLQLLPLGGVSIGEATLKFGLSMRAEVGGRAAGTPAPADTATADAAGGVSSAAALRIATPATLQARQAEPVRLAGRLARTQGTTDGVGQTDANIDIEIKLRQIDLPQGILTLLQQADGGIEERIEVAAEPEPPAPPTPPQDPVEADDLFKVSAVDFSPRDIRAGRALTVELRVSPRRRLSEPLVLEVVVEPQGILERVEPLELPPIASWRDLKVTFLAAEDAARIAGGRSVELLVHGRSRDAETGRLLRRTVTISLGKIRKEQA
jgi:hypothetical protein